jgi:hypothetical protein
MAYSKSDPVKRFIEHENRLFSFPNKQKKTFKHYLFTWREYFSRHTLLYFFFKLMLGIVFLGLPVILFKVISTRKIKEQGNYDSYSYFYATMPLLISTVLILVITFAFLVYKVSFAFRHRLYLIFFIIISSFPCWERRNVGFLIEGFIISFSLMMFILNLSEYLQYLYFLKNKLIAESWTNDMISSGFSNIVLYTIFEENYQPRNSTIFEKNKINEKEVNESIIIYDVLIKLFRPLIFLSLFCLIKVFFL